MTSRIPSHQMIDIRSKKMKTVQENPMILSDLNSKRQFEIKSEIGLITSEHYQENEFQAYIFGNIPNSVLN